MHEFKLFLFIHALRSCVWYQNNERRENALDNEAYHIDNEAYYKCNSCRYKYPHVSWGNVYVV